MYQHFRAPTRAQKAGSAGRRTRTTAALATTVGAAVAATTFALPAQASPSHTVWDRVANCESSGNWHINTGNGFYGGLQFSAGTWRAYHGKKYASQASGASRVEQIEVARRVLAAQGPGAWPVCGPRADLTRHSGQATHAALPAVAGTTSHSTVTAAVAHASHPAAHHATRASRHTSSTKTHGKTYTVHAGDTLSKIASKLHVHGGWKALYRTNHSHLSSPDVLRIGQVLRLP